MAVYVDPAIHPWRRQLWCHMFADSEEELHKFGGRIGMRKAWFQPDVRLPHYDINESRRRVAVALGAVEVGIRFVADRIRSNMAKRQSLVELIESRVPRPVTHWSYSSWSLKQKCDYAWHVTQMLGVKDPAPMNRALLRGIELHKKAEGYLRGEVTRLPREMRTFELHYKRLKKARPIVEQFWGVDKRWRPVNYKSWVVMKMDAAVEPSRKDNVLFIQDFKTGREYEDAHFAQGSLYAPIGFALYPKIDGVIVEFWYGDERDPSRAISSYEFTRGQLKRYREEWLERGHELLEPQRKYLPNPSEDACKWCFLRTDKGGTCGAWRSVRSLR